jgi:hypothetical protein
LLPQREILAAVNDAIDRLLTRVGDMRRQGAKLTHLGALKARQ